MRAGIFIDTAKAKIGMGPIENRTVPPGVSAASLGDIKPPKNLAEQVAEQFTAATRDLDDLQKGAEAIKLETLANSVSGETFAPGVQATIAYKVATMPAAKRTELHTALKDHFRAQSDKVTGTKIETAKEAIDDIFETPFQKLNDAAVIVELKNKTEDPSVETKIAFDMLRGDIAKLLDQSGESSVSLVQLEALAHQHFTGDRTFEGLADLSRASMSPNAYNHNQHLQNQVAAIRSLLEAGGVNADETSSVLTAVIKNAENMPEGAKRNYLRKAGVTELSKGKRVAREAAILTAIAAATYGVSEVTGERYKSAGRKEGYQEGYQKGLEESRQSQQQRQVGGQQVAATPQQPLYSFDSLSEGALYGAFGGATV